MDKAMTASTGGGRSVKAPKALAARVRLWATVNKVMVAKS